MTHFHSRLKLSASTLSGSSKKQNRLTCGPFWSRRPKTAGKSYWHTRYTNDESGNIPHRLKATECAYTTVKHTKRDSLAIMRAIRKGEYIHYLHGKLNRIRQWENLPVTDNSLSEVRNVHKRYPVGIVDRLRREGVSFHEYSLYYYTRTGKRIGRMGRELWDENLDMEDGTDYTDIIMLDGEDVMMRYRCGIPDTYFTGLPTWDQVLGVLPYRLTGFTITPFDYHHHTWDTPRTNFYLQHTGINEPYDPVTSLLGSTNVVNNIQWDSNQATISDTVPAQAANQTFHQPNLVPTDNSNNSDTAEDEWESDVESIGAHRVGGHLDTTPRALAINNYTESIQIQSPNHLHQVGNPASSNMPNSTIYPDRNEAPIRIPWWSLINANYDYKATSTSSAPHSTTNSNTRNFQNTPSRRSSDSSVEFVW